MAEETIVERYFPQSNDAATCMAMMNNNNWSNNPFMYLIWLAFFSNGGFGFGGNRTGLETQGLIAQLQDTVTSNHNNDLAMQAIKGNADAIGQLASNLNCDFNTMSLAINGVRSAIDQVGSTVGLSSERVINSILLGNKDLQAQLAQCCCQNKELILKMGYENLIATLNQTNTLSSRIDQLANGVLQGFSQVGYAAQQHTNDIIQANNANTQRIIDTMTGHWQAETSQKLQDAKFEISQLQQTQYLGSLINKQTTPTT